MGNLASGIGAVRVAYHMSSARFFVLLGEAAAPVSREIHDMMNAGLDKMPDNFIPTMPHLEPEKESERIVFYREYFDKSVELAGGWPHIYLVSREFRDSDS